jgi:hypothetical protein
MNLWGWKVNAKVVGLLGALVAAVVLAYPLLRMSAFEKRAQRAEAASAVLSEQARELQHVADSLAHLAPDTVVQRLTKYVYKIDSINPPPDTCRPNLAARDSLLAALRGKKTADSLSFTGALAAERAANAALTAANDTLSRALAARPRLNPVISFGPRAEVGVWVGFDKTIQPRLGVGISILHLKLF